MDIQNHIIDCKWEKIFDTCEFVTNHFLPHSTHESVLPFTMGTSASSSDNNLDLYRLFYIGREITFSVIDDTLKESVDCTSMDFQKQSHAFWYGNILHACVETLTLSSNPSYSSCLLYLLGLLIENKCPESVDMLSINAYEQTPKEVLIAHMIDGHNDINKHKKHKNTHYIMCLMFSNIKRYHSKIFFVFELFRINVLEKRHKKHLDLCLVEIIYSPPYQVGKHAFDNFPGGSEFHSTMTNLASQTANFS